MRNIDVIVKPNQTYKADDLYQWNKFNTLFIYGLSFGKAPEIHFAKQGMKEALVKQSSMTRDGVISCEIPNQLLETAGTLLVWVANYDGEEFKTFYKLELKVIGRTKPADYIAEDDEKIYSYNALENLVLNTIVDLTRANEDLHAQINSENTALHNQIINEVNSLNDNTLTEVENKLQETEDYVTETNNNTIGFCMGTKGGTTVFNTDGSIVTTYDDGTSETVVFNADGSVTTTYDWGEMGVKIGTTTFNADGSITTTFVNGE